MTMMSFINSTKAEQVFSKVAATHAQTPYYKVMHRQNHQELIAQCRPLVELISSNFDTHIYIGMGGAILNAMLAYSLMSGADNRQKNTHFISTTDPRKFAEVAASIVDLTTTAFIVLSNSGETIETISIMGAFINEFVRVGAGFSNNFFLCIGVDHPNTLKQFADSHGIKTVEYGTELCGRFSCFSNAFVLPAMLAGLDVHKFFNGANCVLDDFWDNQINSKPVQSALRIYQADKPIIATISYSSYLDKYLEWYRQIVSESLGKNGKGFTPLIGIGPQEQHSMLQLYLDGPRDKFYSFIYIEGTQLPKNPVVANGVFSGHFTENKSLNQINRALFDATLLCITRSDDMPYHTLEYGNLSERTLGSLLMHSTLEVVFLGLMMDLNPFDQPAVEAIKLSVRGLLIAFDQPAVEAIKAKAKDIIAGG